MKRIFKVFDAKSVLANRDNNIPEPFTKPACMSAEAGVGAVMADNSQRWNGYIAD